MDTNNQQTYITQQAPQAVPGGERYRKSRLFLFFIFGTTGVIGSVLAAAWIYFKTKVNKRNKYIAVVVGLLLTLVGGFALQQFIFIQNPETRDVHSAVQDVLGEGRTFVGVGWSKTWTNGETYTTRSLSINHLTRHLLTADELHSAALAACNVVNESGQSYDVVTIESQSSVLYPLTVPFVTMSFHGAAPCEGWNDEQMLQQLQQIRSFMNG